MNTQIQARKSTDAKEFKSSNEIISYGDMIASQQTAEIEDLRCERLPETFDKQNRNEVMHKRLLKVIILGDTGKGVQFVSEFNFYF